MTGSRQVVAAVDVGGTLIKSALVSREYEALVELRIPTPPDIGESIGAEVAMIILSWATGQAGRLSRWRSSAVEWSFPGSSTRPPRWPGWRSTSAGATCTSATRCAQTTGLVTVLGHDVRAALVAEVGAGAARGVHNVLFIALGTGIAAAVMVDGQILAADGWAGELGHVVVDPLGPTCACGGMGCLEAMSSASAVARTYARRTGSRLDARAVASLVEGGDPVATEVWTGAVQALARGLVSAVALTGVELILIGGGLAQSGETLLQPLRTAVAEQLTFHRPPRIERAVLGDRAGCLGAAHLAWDLNR